MTAHFSLTPEEVGTSCVATSSSGLASPPPMGLLLGLLVVSEPPSSFPTPVGTHTWGAEGRSDDGNGTEPAQGPTFSGRDAFLQTRSPSLVVSTLSPFVSLWTSWGCPCPCRCSKGLMMWAPLKMRDAPECPLKAGLAVGRGDRSLFGR